VDPTRQFIDTALLVLGIAADVTAALVLLGYFLTRMTILRTIGLPLATVGCVAQFAELGSRWWMTGVWPLTNLYGSLSLFSAMAVAIFLVFAVKYDMAFIGGPVLALAAIALGYGTTWNEGYMPAVPSLQSYWIKIHVPIVVTAYAAFMVAFVLSLTYLFKAYLAPRTARVMSASASAAASATTMTSGGIGSGGSVGGWFDSLPTLGRLDVMQYRVVAVGLPLLSLGIITGALWAKEAWGAYWQWDPKETAALASWIVYAIYMHLHTRPEWKGTRCAWVSVIGFASIVFCYLGVNIWISGLHSYKM
jgi:cytochrome c-type biogenesis protein CcsB